MGMCGAEPGPPLSHHPGLETQRNRPLTEEASPASSGFYTALCQKQEKRQQSKFPLQEGDCGKGDGGQVKVHKPPFATKCLARAAGVWRMGVYLGTRANSLQHVPRLGNEASGRDVCAARRSCGCERKWKLLPAD